MRHDDTPSPAPSQVSQASGANGEALPEWPVLGQVLRGDDPRTSYVRIEDYYCTLAEAWEARARLALAALKTAQIEAGGCSYKASRDFAQMALQSTESICSLAIYAIGPLPSPKEQRT